MGSGRRRLSSQNTSSDQEKWGGKRESNPQPPEPQSGALPVELFPPQESNYSNWWGERARHGVSENGRDAALRAWKMAPGFAQAWTGEAPVATRVGLGWPRRSSPHDLRYIRPTPTYSNPRARRRAESSRFLVSTMTGFLSRCLMRSKSRARNSGQPVPTTSASEPSATA